MRCRESAGSAFQVGCGAEGLAAAVPAAMSAISNGSIQRLYTSAENGECPVKLVAVFTLRPGRSWRHNPSYVTALSALDSEGIRKFDGAEILDVLGIEFDGVDVAARVGETPLFATVAGLVQALLRLMQGAPAAQASIGPGPTYLLMHAHGDEISLSLLSMRCDGARACWARLRAFSKIYSRSTAGCAAHRACGV